MLEVITKSTLGRWCEPIKNLKKIELTILHSLPNWIDSWKYRAMDSIKRYIVGKISISEIRKINILR